MEIRLLSDTMTVRDQLVGRILSQDISTVLVIDGAGQDPVLRGGSARRIYEAMGLEVRICDPLTEAVPSLDAFDVIHMSGGNPFRLIKGARKSGLQRQIEARAADRPLLVVGASAGAMVMGNSIEHAAILQPRLRIQDFAGFGWVDQRVMPHVDKPGAYADVIRAHLAREWMHDWLELKEDAFEALQFDPAPATSPSPY